MFSTIIPHGLFRVTSYGSEFSESQSSNLYPAHSDPEPKLLFSVIYTDRYPLPFQLASDLPGSVCPANTRPEVEESSDMNIS